jgi:DnaJ-class molecular chaperone
VAEKRLYRELARKFHPDLADTAVERAYRTSMMAAVNNAYTNDNIEALYDLAGELEPDELAELAQIESLEVRKVRQQIMQCQQRQRRAQRRLQSLMQENTSRLWQKANELADGSEDWWNLVRRELEQAINRRQQEISALENQITAEFPYTTFTS